MNYQKRIQDFQSQMEKNNIAAALLTRRGCVSYFTGVFTPWRSAIMIPRQGDAELITHRYDAHRVKAHSYIKNVTTWVWEGDAGYSDAIINAVKEYAEKGAIGIELDTAESLGVLSALEYMDLTKAYPHTEFKNVLGIVNNLMIYKEDEEIELLRRAAEVADASMQAVYDALEVGISEYELAAIAEYAGRKAGSMYNWSVTGTEVGSGYRQSYQDCFTCIPSAKLIQYGDMVTIDVHPMIDLYLGDLALNAVVGQPTSAQMKLANNWKEIVDYLISQFKPGAVANDIANKTWEKVEKLNMTEQCIPLFGHGLGVDARIPPTITPQSAHVLHENMVFEAIVQVAEPGVGGLRLEAPVLVTASGAEVLCKTPLELYIKK